MKSLFARLAELGTKEAVVGIPHRGRLNFLTGLLDYPPRLLFRKIDGGKDIPSTLYGYIDDVTSHLACSTTKSFSNHSLTITAVHNPSHL